MSDDLISKKAVIALIDKLGYINVSNRDNFNANLRMDKVRQEVVKLPTAFDKEKVIEELKEEGCIIDDEAGNRAVEISLYIHAFERMLKERNKRGKESKWETGEEVFSWWMENDDIPGQMFLDEICGDEN